MSLGIRQIIALEEDWPRSLQRDELPEAAGELLWRQYSTQVEVEFPSPATGGQWQLTAQGAVGHIPLTPELSIALLPKVPMRSLFGMLEYAYDLQSFRFLDGWYEAHSLDELYERLAEALARRVLRRCRDGLVRAYIGQNDELSVVRGSLNVRRMASRPWDTRLECDYQEHTADIDDNQILAWTLFVISRSGLCRPDRALPTVHQAFRQLQGAVTLTPVSAAACVGRRYHRLNLDYGPLHALCRFFLDSAGPHQAVGERAMLPFLVDTARLYEQFVSAWLAKHLPAGLRLAAQEPYTIDRGLSFAIDLVIRDTITGEAHCVLDTKYKRVDMPSTSDIAQVVAYAEATGCKDALLVYPAAPQRALDAVIGDIRVRSVIFDLADDIQQAGYRLMEQIAPSLRGSQ
ncbi:MAG: restriction endonuclease [Chloroflexales bacterium]|nr:restriction endonuclease [Chloroflexales bacterium]